MNQPCVVEEMGGDEVVELCLKVFDHLGGVFAFGEANAEGVALKAGCDIPHGIMKLKVMRENAESTVL